MKTRTTLAVALLAIALGVGGWLVLRPRADQSTGGSKAVAAHDRKAPSLAVRLHRKSKASDPSSEAAPEVSGADTSPETEPPENPPPPEVYVQADAPPPKPKPALRLHVVTPWGDLPQRELGGSKLGGSEWYGGTTWTVLPPEGVDEMQRGASFDDEGNASMDEEALTLWSSSHWSLRVTAPACREVLLQSPPNPLPDTLTVQLEAEGPVAHFRGRVRDDRGRPLAASGIFDEAVEYAPGVRASPDGSFDLALPSIVIDENLLDEEVPLLAVAPGFLATTVHCRPGGESGLDITLERDAVHGRLELRFLHPDGSPAPRTRAWLLPPAKTWQDAFGWEGSHERAEGREAETRRYLPRVVGGQSAEEQGYSLSQEGPMLHDLVADEEGKVVVPSMAPGSYHLRAAQAIPTGDYQDPPEVYEFQVHETLDTSVAVEPPPKTTTLELRLQAGRTVTGRIEVAVNPAWHCDHGEHEHWLRIDDWTWGQVHVRSGVSQRDGRTPLTGRFRFDGLPRSACRLRVATYREHPDVVIDLPAVDDANSGPFDIGTITVPDARTIQFRLVREDGTDIPSGWKGSVSLTGVPDAEPKDLTGTWSSSDVSILLPTPPGPDATIVVRVEGREEPAVVVHAPFDFGPGKPVVIKVPATLPPATSAQATPTKEPPTTAK